MRTAFGAEGGTHCSSVVNPREIDFSSPPFFFVFWLLFFFFPDGFKSLETQMLILIL